MQNFRYNMKKLLSIIVAIVISLSLCAAQNRLSGSIGSAYGLFFSNIESGYSYTSSNLSDLYEPTVFARDNFALSFEYGRMIGGRFSLGANLRSGFICFRRTSGAAYVQTTSEHYHYLFTLSPVARYNLTKPENGVVFYVKAETGVGLITGDLTGTKWLFDYFVPVGMALGHSLRGFVEVGVGSTSIARFGLEYDF